MSLPTLVLLHAFPLDARMWDGVRAGLAPRFDLVTPDQRGFGSASLGAAEPSLDVVAADVVALLDSLGLDRVLLGGCSMGGYAAMAVLRAAPERVSGLVLVDTKATADTPDARANRLAVADRAEAEGVGPWLPDAMLPNLLGPSSGPHATDTVRELVLAQRGASVAWAQRAMAARPDSRETLRAGGVPTLVVHGESDALMPLDVAYEMAALTHAELRVIPGSGHLPPVEAPDAFVAALADWPA